MKNNRTRARTIGFIVVGVLMLLFVDVPLIWFLEANRGRSEPITGVFITGIVLLLITIGASIGGANLAPLLWMEFEVERHKLEAAVAKIEKHPEKARPTWDLATVTLNTYFNRNLAQITYIFWLSIGAIIVGFFVILWGVVQSVANPVVIAPAIITVSAGVVTEFLGATFILIYKSAIQQAVGYAEALERINSVGMAMQILDTMPDGKNGARLKNETKAALVKLLVTQAHTVPQTNDRKSHGG
jgi:hypothetical protein